MHSNIKSSDKMTKEVVLNNRNSNIGALLYQIALEYTLKCEDNFIDSENFYKRCKKYDEFANFVNDNYDCVIFSMGDLFRIDLIKNNILNNILCFLKKLKTKTLVIGVGVKILYSDDIESFLSYKNMGIIIKEFINENLKRSNIIGIRDEMTANVLDRLGFNRDKDYYICGCPSFFINGDKLKIPYEFPDINNETKIAINRNFNIKGFPNAYKFFDENLKKYNNYNIFNSFFYEMINMKLKSNKYGGGSCCYLNYEDYIKLKFVSFVSLKKYLSALSNYDICIGERMHGCAAAIAAGVPTFLISVDNRMEGLAKYHKIPYIRITDIDEKMNFSEMIKKVGSLKEMHIKHKENFKRYCNFFEMNNIKTIYNQK